MKNELHEIDLNDETVGNAAEKAGKFAKKAVKGAWKHRGKIGLGAGAAGAALGYKGAQKVKKKLQQ